MSDVDVPEGFPPGFSRNCEAIFKAAQMGAVLSMEELRHNLRLAGMELGPDEVPVDPFDPEQFSIPQPPPDDNENETPAEAGHDDDSEVS